jgi:hypothetical protein
MTALIISGPSRCGKTQHAESLAKHYGKSKILDGWHPGRPLPDNTLILTNVVNVPGAIRFEDAMKELKGV